MEEIMSQPGVVGALLVDNAGLPISAKGTTKQDGAGIVTLLSKKSKQLGHVIGQGEDPTIVIECDTGTLLIRPQKLATLVIQKST